MHLQNVSGEWRFRVVAGSLGEDPAQVCRAVNNYNPRQPPRLQAYC